MIEPGTAVRSIANPDCEGVVTNSEPRRRASGEGRALWMRRAELPPRFARQVGTRTRPSHHLETAAGCGLTAQRGCDRAK
jgi:hypothetical protein